MYCTRQLSFISLLRRQTFGLSSTICYCNLIVIDTELEYGYGPEIEERNRRHVRVEQCEEVVAEWGIRTVALTEQACHLRPTGRCQMVNFADTIKTVHATSPLLNTYYYSRLTEEDQAEMATISLPTMNGIAEISDSLKTAGLRPPKIVAVRSPASLAIDKYLRPVAKLGSFPVSSGLRIYPHDVVDHALLALAIEHESWRLFGLVAEDALQLSHAQKPPAGQTDIYHILVAHALDTHTDSVSGLLKPHRTERSLLNRLIEEIDTQRSAYKQDEPRGIAIDQVRERIDALLKTQGGADVYAEDQERHINNIHRFREVVFN